jgi:hypothetical protein
MYLAEGDIAMPRHLMFVLLVVIAVEYAVPPGHSEVVG